MHGKPTLTKKLAHIQRQAQRQPSSGASTPSGGSIDIGDWSLAQDKDGALIIHHVYTGNRIIIARP